MNYVNHPGSWQSYLLRGDNVGLPLMEVRDKYLQEQLLFENYMSFVQQQQLFNVKCLWWWWAITPNNRPIRK